MRIELSSIAKRQLTEYSDQHGMTQVAMMSRLMEWFATQDDTIQSAVLGHYPTSLEADIAKLILKRLAAGKS